jgi:putative flippase GtrA
MSSLIVRFWRLRRTPEGKTMFRYTMVSVISTGVFVVTLGLVYGVFRVWTEVPSTLFANAVATVPSYYLNRRWAWGKSGRSHVRREVLPFWALSIAGMLLSIVTSSEARRFGIAHFDHDHLARTVLVEGANLVAFACLWVIKFMVFKRLFRVTPVGGATATDAGTGRDEESELIEAGPLH